MLIGRFDPSKALGMSDADSSCIEAWDCSWICSRALNIGPDINQLRCFFLPGNRSCLLRVSLSSGVCCSVIFVTSLAALVCISLISILPFALFSCLAKAPIYAPRNADPPRIYTRKT